VSKFSKFQVHLKFSARSSVLNNSSIRCEFTMVDTAKLAGGSPGMVVLARMLCRENRFLI